MTTGELRRSFHDDLADLQHRVSTLAGVIVGGLGIATAAVLQGSTEARDSVVNGDRRIDEAYPGIERDVFELVARQAPVARDLRFLIASLRIAQEIERSGDLLASIGRRGPTLDPAALTPTVRDLVGEMSAHGSSMFGQATGAYRTLDAVAARRIPALDDAIDELHRRLLAELFAAEDGLVGSIVELGLIARFYERIADHAVVIAERVCFVVDGSMNATDADESSWP